MRAAERGAVAVPRSQGAFVQRLVQSVLCVSDSRWLGSGKVIGNKWEQYLELLEDENSQGEALDQLGLPRYCCRRMIMTRELVSVGRVVRCTFACVRCCLVCRTARFDCG